MTKAKCIILDGVKDHVVQHISEKETAKEMWYALKKLYQHTSVQRKMLLKNQLWSYQMQKGKQIDYFLGQLKEIHDQLTSIGATPDDEILMRTALNAVFEEWEIFVQSILGKASLPDSKELWGTLRQEEIRQLTKTGGSSKGVWIKKEEEEDAALASARQQGKRKNFSKVKCLHCGELNHYATQCPKKKNKREASDSKATPAKAEKEV